MWNKSDEKMGDHSRSCFQCRVLRAASLEVVDCLFHEGLAGDGPDLAHSTSVMDILVFRVVDKIRLLAFVQYRRNSHAERREFWSKIVYVIFSRHFNSRPNKSEPLLSMLSISGSIRGV